jgi:hypothetical protein
MQGPFPGIGCGLSDLFSDILWASILLYTNIIITYIIGNQFFCVKSENTRFYDDLILNHPTNVD